MVSNLKLERIKRETTQMDLSMKTGIPQWRISLIERGIPPMKDEAERIAQALSCRIIDIFPQNETAQSG